MSVKQGDGAVIVTSGKHAGETGRANRDTCGGRFDSPDRSLSPGRWSPRLPRIGLEVGDDVLEIFIIPLGPDGLKPTPPLEVRVEK